MLLAFPFGSTRGFALLCNQQCYIWMYFPHMFFSLLGKLREICSEYFVGKGLPPFVTLRARSIHGMWTNSPDSIFVTAAFWFSTWAHFFPHYFFITERIKGKGRKDQKLIKSNQIFFLTFIPDSNFGSHHL